MMFLYLLEFNIDPTLVTLGWKRIMLLFCNIELVTSIYPKSTHNYISVTFILVFLYKVSQLILCALSYYTLVHLEKQYLLKVEENVRRLMQ